MADYERKRRLWETGWRDLHNKVDQIKDLIKQRNDEQLELQRVVELKRIKANDLKDEVKVLKDH